MAINPLSYTEKIVQSFLRYQVTAYPFADERLNSQMRKLLSLDSARQTPLLKGPFVSLSRAFRPGCSVAQLIKENIFHPHMAQLIQFPNLYGHQEAAIRSIHDRAPTLISTGTGSGKTECFLYPTISRCLEIRDQKEAPGICAVFVYPMNALAEDQLGRLRAILAGSGITFGMYVGKTPKTEAEVTGRRLSTGSSNADYLAALKHARERGEGIAIHPPEEICSRELMRTAGHQPRILLTNVKQLELLLTRQNDIELFDNARLDFLIFDEAHTFTGAQGAEAACLVRRLRTFCGKSPEDTVCVATSATIVDEQNPDAAREFASRFFGVAAERVITINEIYEREVWADKRTIPPAPANPIECLKEILTAIDARTDPDVKIRKAWKTLAGTEMPSGDWATILHQVLSANELLFQAAELLTVPQPLSTLIEKLGEQIKRKISEEELIAWLTLGAAARKEDRPLIRPVVHGFLRGIQGAVVTFDDDEGADLSRDQAQPVLHLSAEEDIAEEEDEEKLRLAVWTCTKCGQHYYEHTLADFDFTSGIPGGGTAVGEAVYWPREELANGGRRLLLVDRLISAEEDDDTPHERMATLYLCRKCGAAHEKQNTRCLACGTEGTPIILQTIRQKPEWPGYLTRCVCCDAAGRSFGQRYREPIRRVRATNVADVHVLAQDMIHHAERKRLLVFADNRQDAAFQAGWMIDHARRFRIRSLMYQALQAKPLSIIDMTHILDRQMDDDESLSRALLPEVWAVAPKDAGGNFHRDERKYLLRILTLREITSGMKETVGLEPWGRIKIQYVGLNASAEFFSNWSNKLKMPTDDLLCGIEAVLDLVRRKHILYDSARGIFSKYWMEGDRELQNGYLPEMRDVPKGLKLTRDPGDDKSRVDQWHSPGHQTLVSQIALKWGVSSDDMEIFLSDLWKYLTSDNVAILKPVTLKGSKDKALPKCAGTYQVDGDKLMITSNKGYHRCRVCRRRSIRMPPAGKCLAWRCDGTVEFQTEDSDNYDLQLIDQQYDMIRPREHTAMVPSAERERIEELFKGESTAINTLVCTQTLEMGVDIGSLDAILMRNVPPRPANYWQRAGRAGRRHRMAVNMTYCRPVSHDRAYFAEPVKMLHGRIDPPVFNLSNDVMISKHIHAAVLTRLHQLAREGSTLSASDRDEIRESLKVAFPTLIRDYLFDENGEVKSAPRDVGPLHTVITKQKIILEEAVIAAFRQGWPLVDAAAVSSEKLSAHVFGMTDELSSVISRLFRRLKWAMLQLHQLQDVQRRFGALDDEQKSFYERCYRYVSKLKTMPQRQRTQNEGVDDVVTYSVLAAEGFLPGHGLDSGSVIGMAQVPRSIQGLVDFDLPRPPSVAIREYVPGNLIYANGQKFVPRCYHFDISEGRSGGINFEINPERQAVKPVSGNALSDPSAACVVSLPICDVTLLHTSRISDDEENRFQMGVAIFGRELDQHDGGRAYTWGAQPILLRKGVRLQLVNVGPTKLIESKRQLGYPVCRTCGQSVSPLSSTRQRDDFDIKHREWGHGEQKTVAFHADLAVDALTLPGCKTREEAFSIAEALRFAAAELLDMELDDLQVLILGRFDSDECDALLYDPMPGGSGLLEQMCERFSELVVVAQKIASECAGLCAMSCIDCFQTFRNGFYHKYLNRHLMLELMTASGDKLEFSHDIPPKQPATQTAPSAQGVNVTEQKLRRMLLAAGLPEGRRNEQILLPRPLGSTTPDVIFDDPDDRERKIFIYLDGLSEHIHGNPETRAKDIQIRTELRQNHEVIEITAVDLDDQEAMSRHFRKLARSLIGREAVDHVKNQADIWFAARVETIPKAKHAKRHLRLIVDNTERIRREKFESLLPFLPLEAACGEPSQVFDDETVIAESEWIDASSLSMRLTKEMFAVLAVGDSMEPDIYEGDIAVFRRAKGVPKQDHIVLARFVGASDPDTNASYGIKKYSSEKQEIPGEESWQHTKIILTPRNKKYSPIIIEPEHEGDFDVVGVFVGVIHQNEVDLL